MVTSICSLVVILSSCGRRGFAYIGAQGNGGGGYPYFWRQKSMLAPMQGSVKPQFNNLVINYFARIESVLQLIAGVVDTGDKHSFENIFANFRKNSKRPQGSTQGPRGHWFMKKTWSRKSRVRLPLWAWGTLIHEKNLRSKISCQTPSNIAEESAKLRWAGRGRGGEWTQCPGLPFLPKRISYTYEAHVHRAVYLNLLQKVLEKQVKTV